MRHRKGVYCCDCTCPDCEAKRSAILLGSNPALSLSKQVAETSAGWRCPQCGAAVVIMSAACQVIAAPDGSLGVLEGFEWLPISSAKCYAACGWFGQAKDAELSEFGQPEGRK